jgi:class 3 adenylate cyclase
MNIKNMCYRIIAAFDMEKSTTRTNPTKARLRHVMYEAIDQALRAAGMAERDPFIDCGDGVLVLLHPTERGPKLRLLDTVMPQLAARLDDHRDQPLRLRAVVHAGEVHYDQQGCFGESLDVAFRLLNAPRVKIELHHSLSPLTVVVSDDIYRSIVRHGYPGITETA